MLRFWRDGTDLKLARRAWLVLEEADGRLETDLALATGMKSSAVQAVVRSFRRLGLMGLVDAPRSGRPSATIATCMVQDARQGSAREAALVHGVSADTVWRRARLAGLSIERSTGRNRPVPPSTAAPTVVGVYSDDSTAVVLVAARQAIEKQMSPMGSCHSADRRKAPPAGVAASRDWLQALRELRETPGTAAARARSETQEWTAHRFAKLIAAGAALSVVMGGDPTTSGFVRWLGVFRTLLERERSSQSDVRLTCAAQPEDWQLVLERHGVPRTLALPVWPNLGARPFAWCRNTRSMGANVALGPS